MRREGRLHGHESRKDHARVLTHNKPTNRSRFTEKCRRRRCRGCSYHPTAKSMNKGKGQHKALGMDVTRNLRMIEWAVSKHGGEDPDDDDDVSEEEDCGYGDEEFVNQTGHAEEDLHRACAEKLSSRLTDDEVSEEDDCAHAGKEIFSRNGHAEQEFHRAIAEGFVSQKSIPAEEELISLTDDGVSEEEASDDEEFTNQTCHVEEEFHCVCFEEIASQQASHAVEEFISLTDDEDSEEESSAHADEEFTDQTGHAEEEFHCVCFEEFISQQTRHAEQEFISETDDIEEGIGSDWYKIALPEACSQTECDEDWSFC